MTGDFYAVLGVPISASQAEIKAAYQKLAKSLHPDINSHGSALMQAVNEAYETLGDAKKRKEYDRSGKVKTFPQMSEAPARPAVVDAMNPDGSFNFLKLVGHVAPVTMRDALAPFVGAVLEHVGVDPKAATVGQMLNAAGVIKSKVRTRRAG